MNKVNSSYAITHRGAVRALNEDAHAELNSHNLWVVADGMGGHEAGDYASQLVVDVIKSTVQQMPPSALSLSLVIAAIKDANKQLNEYSSNYLNNKTLGSTVTVLFIKDGFYHVLWAGDSRVYLFRNNTLQQLSRDHSQVNELVDEGVISFAEAKDHPLANVITRAVGVSSSVEVDTIKNGIQTGDIFLLCSDGLTGELTDQEISLALGPKNIIDSGMALMHSSLVRGARDNVTFILVKHDDSEVEDKYTCENVNNIDELTIPILTRDKNNSIKFT
ncbi:PP2C family protein-serine/threonine phosphatase [Pseudoalteromonas mariniglutinosa]|uniref:PP2C family protein-serine/threonine phosphatase n=1 Tax=Pseudoalteromonas mariniglutinosa TaxID=206042 RepID=UPI0038510730